jgi:putative DNA methylase
LVDDPSEHPDDFPSEQAQDAERQRLFRIIEQLVQWENTTNERVLDAARAEIQRSCSGAPPAILDPFAGGGSIPLEAQRLGLEARGQDLNPVAVLINKSLIEIPTRFSEKPPIHPDVGQLRTQDSWRGACGLAEDVRYYGGVVRERAERRIGALYPPATLRSGEHAPVIAWFWARLIKSPNPAWDGPMPLVRSFELSSRKGVATWVAPVLDRSNKTISFEIRTGPGCPDGTVGRTGATCLATGTAVPLSYVRQEAKAGRMTMQLMAVVADGPRGRVYLAPDSIQENASRSAVPPLDVPDTELPEQALGFRVQAYGMTKHRHLFSNRQLAALCAFSDEVRSVQSLIVADGGSLEYANAVVTYLAFAVDKGANYWSMCCGWHPKLEKMMSTFGRQSLQMLWTPVEANPFSQSSGNFMGGVTQAAKCLETMPATQKPGSANQVDAATLSGGVACIITDPPYYDNIGYADLSDFFYVWLRRTLHEIYPQLFATLLVPKRQEMVSEPFRFGGDRKEADRHFVAGLNAAFDCMREIQLPEFPLAVFYAFKQSESNDEGVASTGWETMLEGLLRAGFTINGTWPMRTEQSAGLRELGRGALASSIVLICRPRKVDATLASRKEFLSALKAELPGAMRALQQANIAPVDLAQSAIGPGMAVFSRYAKVLDAEGNAVTVRAALSLINQVLDELLTEEEGELDPGTRWALAWFEQFGFAAGPYGIAETLSKAKNTSVQGLEEAGLLRSVGGKVQLIAIEELAASWDPRHAKRLTVWEVTHHLSRRLSSGGESAAGEVLHEVGGVGAPARDLAYRLYLLCERKKWSKEALAYNSLVVAWPEIMRQAAQRSSGVAVQQLMEA